jgi:N-dimethylarginine dimethylaminohydrolase
MYSVNYVWDKLKVCAVGQAYPPEFYSFINDFRARSVMERIAEETEEDYQELIKVLERFNVQVVRTSLPSEFLNNHLSGKYFPAPMTPRDHCAMIGNKFYMSRTISKWNILRGQTWPVTPPKTDQEFNFLPEHVRKELANFGVTDAYGCYDFDHSGLDPLKELVLSQGNEIIYDQKVDTAMTMRLGQDLIFGTWPSETVEEVKERMVRLFPKYNCYVIKTNGHLDGRMSILRPGLVVANSDIELGDYFKDWQVIRANIRLGDIVKGHEFNKLKQNNKGKWLVPGEEQNQTFTDYVESYLSNWLGYIEETTIDVNMLPIDKNNVICINNNQIEDKLIDQGIYVHSVRLRHHLFWDGGVHCVTNDLDRGGN